MKLTRKQEVKLIDLGMSYLINEFDINQLIGKRVTIKKPKVKAVKEPKKKSKFTAAQRKAMSKRMKMMWKNKKLGKKNG